MKTRWSIRLLVVIAVGLVAYGIAELAVRVLDVPPRPVGALPVFVYRLSENPILQFEYIPDNDEKAAFGFVTNADGFRDQTRPEQKPDGTVRIAFLGDSVTVGRAVTDRFTDRLQGLLNDQDDGTTYEVFNFGVGGYQTLQEVEALRVHGLKYALDCVVVVFCQNDFRLDANGGIYQALLSANPLHGPVRHRSALGSLLGASRLAFVLYSRYFHEPSPIESTRYEDEYLRGRSTVAAGLDLLAQLREEYGFRVLFVVLPGFDRPFSDYRWHDVHERALSDARNSGVPAIDLLEDFRRIDEDARVFGNDVWHPNTYGHEVLARILHERLRQPWSGSDAPDRDRRPEPPTR